MAIRAGLEGVGCGKRADELRENPPVSKSRPGAPKDWVIGLYRAPFPHCRRMPVRSVVGRLTKPMGAICWVSVRFSAWA